MTRASVGSLRAPNNAILLADFTDGSIPAGQITTDAGSPAASGRAYSYDSRGVMISLTGGTTGQYASMRWEPGTVMDLSSAGWLGIEVDVPEDGNGAYLNSVAIFVTVEAGATFTNYYNISRKSGSGLTPARQLVMARLPPNETWTTTGSPTLATIRKLDIRMVIHANSQNIPAKYFIRRIWVGRNRPKLIISFDDGMDGQYNHALPELEAAGMKAALALAPNLIGSAGRMTEANLQELYDAGWDFGIQQFGDSDDIPVNFSGLSGLTSDGAGTATFSNVSNIAHGLSAGQQVAVSGAMSPAYNGLVTILSTPEDYSFTYAISGTPTTPDTGWATCPRLTEAQAKLAWSRTLEWMRARGWTRGNEFAAYSNGVTNEWVESWMPSLGFRMARTTRINTSPWRGFDPRVTDERAMMRLPGITMDQQNATTILGYVDNFIAYGVSGILYAHDIDATPASLTVTLSEWQAMVAGIKLRRDRGLIDVITPSEFMRQLRISRATPS